MDSSDPQQQQQSLSQEDNAQDLPAADDNKKESKTPIDKLEKD